jgi:Flp pilus assembly protein TadD
MSRSQPTSAQLKEEGNALFKEHNYTAARSKYTQSLALNGTNAVVYANRALCALKLKLYVRLHAAFVTSACSTTRC